jgi:pilus assembly protein CpaF
MARYQPGNFAVVVSLHLCYDGSTNQGDKTMITKKDISKTIEAMTTLLADDDVTEIMVDGPDQVYVEREGKLEDTDIRFTDDQQVIDWANDLLTAHGWEPVGKGRPWAEGRLPEGDRLLVVIPPVAIDSPSVVVRKFWRSSITLDQILQFGSFNQTILDFLKVVMQARLNVIIAGGTNSGKTTLANRVIELTPAEERLIAVERAHELRIGRIQHKRLVYLEAEAAGASGIGEVDMSELLRLAARMRPDRLIVGELEGDEALEMLQLMNTGYEGTVTLIHANGPRDTLTRLETMVTIAEPSLTLPVIRAKMAAALDLIVHASLLEDGSRKIVSITEVQGLKGDNIVLQELFTWEKTGIGEDGRFTGAFKATGVAPSFAPALEAIGLTFPEGMFEPEA